MDRRLSPAGAPAAAVSAGSAAPAAIPAALQPGRPGPMGARVEAGGVNFAVFSAHASAIELCLFDATGTRETHRLPLPARSGDVWHGRLDGAGTGLVYGFRVHGPWQPALGHRFNPAKLLLDPWAREIVTPPGGFDWREPHGAARRDDPLAPCPRDNATAALKARVVADPPFDWGDDRPPHTPWADTIVYELHVKGFTQRMPGVPEALRGTYAGLASPAAIAHLQRLGVTAVELLPVHQHVDEQHLAALGLPNYWGYNTVGFFCPEPRYAATANPRTEFQAMVRALHAAGIEVILDVVYNHTMEGDERGPSVSWRGFDQAAWYRLSAAHPGHCENLTGCGNTLDIRQPQALRLVMDSLRFWVQEMHVDGFRFDLAPVLGRGEAGFSARATFFQAVQQDPALAGVKWIAEPWDIAPDGYRLGGFPAGWGEWNDRFRDTVRKFWLGGDVTRGEFARRLAGSADVFQHGGRTPAESVNYVVSHDGFTLADLVAYDHRHNEANGEGNRDGTAQNHSWNCGWEGPTADPAVNARRARLQRALLASVLLAQGTPMLAAGDELGHTQHGNNNPYCQDNETTWIDWARADTALLAYTERLLALRRRLLPLAADHWYSGQVDVRGRPDLTWLRRSGEPPSADEWNSGRSRVLGALIGAPGRSAAPVLLLFNGRDFDTAFTLPPGPWRCELDSAEPDGASGWLQDAGEPSFVLRAHSVAVLVLHTTA